MTNLIARLQAAQLRGNAKPEDVGAGGLLDQAAKRLEKLEAVYQAARGMCHGYDWNKGTAAEYHRADLVRAVNAVDPLPDQCRTELRQEPQE